MKKRILSLILVLALAFSLLVFPASAADPTSGTCGENVTWTLDENGVLTISGEGAMRNYSDAPFSSAPWEKNQSEIRSVVVESGVTSVGDYAFYNCENLETVSAAAGVETIGNHAFYNCKKLMSAQFGQGLTSIGDYAFYSCKALTQMPLPDGLLSIGEEAFDSCSELSDVVLPETLTSIGSYAFDTCGYNLTEITIPESVTSIGNYVFSNCWGLKRAELPEGMTVIKNSMFNNCYALESVVIPGSVTAVETWAFNQCTALKDVYFGGTEEQWAAISVASNNAPLTSATIHYTEPQLAVLGSGTCGANVNWVLTEDGVMTISGTGWMIDYNTVTDRPWYDVKDSITSVVVEEGVTSIGSYAFQTCTALQEVSLPEGVTLIGCYAFQGCSSLTSVVIPNGVTCIEAYAFSACSRLTDVVIPDSVTSIGVYAFSGCYSLTSVVIPSSVTSIRGSTFAGCSSLISVVIPDSVTSIDNYAFVGCSGLTSVVIPDSVTSIGGWVFENCSSLTSVNIPDSVTSIGSSTFSYCSSLTTVNIPDSVTNIKAYAFSNCTSLTDVYYGGTEEQWSAITIGEKNDPLTSATIHYTEPQPAILDEGDYDTLHWVLTDDGTVTISGTGYIQSGLQNSWSQWGSMVKSIVIEPGVTGIGSSAFSECSSLTSVTIPESVTGIGEWAFYACRSLASATIPEGVTSIGAYTFCDCKSLTNVNIPIGVTSIRECAFQNCSSLTSVNIPEGVTSLGNYAFRGCSSLVSVNIPDSVTGIGKYSFFGCSSLVSVNIPASVTSIGNEAFRGCTAMTEITVDPENSKYQSIDGVLFNKSGTQLIVCPAGKTGDFAAPAGTLLVTDFAFEKSALTNITLPESVISIGNSVFSECANLETVTLPASAEGMKEQPFNQCTRLKSVVIPDGVTEIGYDAFNKCSSLESVTIPESVTSIEYEAFRDCSSLTSVNIPEGVTSIGRWSFAYCNNLMSVTIPDSVTSIGNYAFYGCGSRIQDVYYGGNEDQWAAISIGSDNGCLTYANIHFGASTPGKIESDPVDATAPVGGTAVFTVTASGDIASYQWQYSDNGGASWANSKSTADSVTCRATAARNGRLYRCVVTDADGNSVTSDAAALMVVQPVQITGDPVDSVGKIGGVAAFAVEAEGEGLTYQWQYSDNDGDTWKNSTTNKSAVATCKITAARDGRLYRCVVTDAFGKTATSDAAKITVKAALAITAQPKDYTGAVGGTAAFTVKAVGAGLTYQWQFKDPGGSWTNSKSTAASATCKLTAARDGRMYRCIVTDVNGNTLTSDTATITVQ